MADLMIYKETALKRVSWDTEAYNAINMIPSIDAVEVVRCKDCMHLFDGTHRENCCEILMAKAKWIQEITVDENWYCADGERRPRHDLHGAKAGGR